jgi:hypothetical protein
MPDKLLAEVRRRHERLRAHCLTRVVSALAETDDAPILVATPSTLAYDSLWRERGADAVPRRAAFLQLTGLACSFAGLAAGGGVFLSGRPLAGLCAMLVSAAFGFIFSAWAWAFSRKYGFQFGADPQLMIGFDALSCEQWAVGSHSLVTSGFGGVTRIAYDEVGDIFVDDAGRIALIGRDGERVAEIATAVGPDGVTAATIAELIRQRRSAVGAFDTAQTSVLR